ncbi:ABC transporter ATP-binding protein, partial [bacterium]
GIRVIKNFSQEKGALDYFNLANRDYFKKYLALVKVWGVFEPLLIFLASMTITTVLYFGGVRTITGSITLGEFIAFISYLAILIWPIIGLGWVVNVIEQGKTSMGRIMKLMEEKPRIKDTGKIREIKGVIEFRNVTFSYNGRKVLEDINLVFEPGKFTAIVGKTGSGKTTIVNLLLRFYETSGIFVDGNPIEDISLYALRKAVGWVPQETFLFSDTIRNNIAFGKPDASLEEIERVAKLAGIYDEIMSFPGGFDTVLGERGVNLSGGQRQRIAIARALLLAPPVFILDDALSSVDSHTEVKIMENIRDFLKERTSIVISHRLSAIQDADEIVVMDRGRIVERGTHSELIRKDGLYREMYEKQKLRELLE